MVCKICGKTLPEGSNVCRYCGAHVRAGSQEKKPVRRYSKKGLARKRLINLIIALLALLMISAVVIGVIWSARQAGEKGSGDQQIQQNDPSAETPEDPADAEEPADDEEEEEIQRPQGSIIQQRPQVVPEAGEDEDPEDAEDPGETDAPQTGTDGETGTDPADPPQTQTPSGNYTISINRTETTASLNHYRELYVYINETLPAGVSIVETTWTSSNPNVVRAEPGKAWGVSVGTATVTGTITLSDGQKLSASCTVNVVVSQTGTTTVTGDYVLPDSSTRLITSAELDSLSSYQLWIARNEIYARHGRKFTNTDLANYFAGKSWYNGTIEAASFDESLLTSIERQNVDAILAEEASR